MKNSQIVFSILLSILLALIGREYKNSQNVFDTLHNVVKKKGLHLLHSTFILFLIHECTYKLCIHFLDTIRSTEHSALNENCMYYLSDLVLIVSIFSDTLSMQNFLVFILIIAQKCSLWVFDIRSQTQKDTRVFRYGVSITIISTILFSACLLSALFSPSIHILFCFEFFVIMIGAVRTLCAIEIDRRVDEDEVVFICLINDIIYNIVKLIGTGILFVWTSLSLRVPFNILRDIAKTVIKLVSLCKNYFALKRIFTNLNLYEDVFSGTCPICRDDIDKGKRIGCGHFFHVGCIRRWAEKQQECPVCRTSLFSDEIVQINDGDETIFAVRVTDGGINN